jgi:multidrug efflux system outer membrane protein
VASVANAYYTWQADQALLKLTEETLKTYEESYNLTRRSNEVGVASALDVSQARTAVENARVKYSQYQRLVAQDVNSLTVLLGTGIPANLAKPLELDADQLAEVPAGLPSDLLQRRPDIQEAEHLLKAANANIGAARAAFFPSISLTANAGSLSPDLGHLFKGGSGTWLFQPQINLPIFNAGSLRPAWTTRRSRRTSTSPSTKRPSRPPSRKSPMAWPRARPSKSSCRRSVTWCRPTRTTTAWPSAATASVSTAT